MARPNSGNPTGYNWHARKMFGPDAAYDQLSDNQRLAVDEARLQYLRGMSAKGTKALALKTAQRLRERAAALEAGAT